MKYKINHTTVYEYSSPVPVCQNMVHLMPRTTNRQQCTYYRLNIRPNPMELARRIDYFGNSVQNFSIHQGHKVLRVTAISKVRILPLPGPPLDAQDSMSWELLRDTVRRVGTPFDLAAYEFCFDSPHAGKASELARYGQQSFTPGRPILDAAIDLNRRIHEEFTYDPKATDVHTPCLEVFRQRRGVCQDLAHVAIGCIRSVGLPARYVSGYLRTVAPEGKPRLVGADASHAWLSVYCGDLGWVDLDPTNNVLPSDEHVTLAWGRDYQDVAPIRGMFVGGGKHSISVSVDMVALEPDHGQAGL